MVREIFLEDYKCNIEVNLGKNILVLLFFSPQFQYSTNVKAPYLIHADLTLTSSSNQHQIKKKCNVFVCSCSCLITHYRKLS